MVFQVNKGARFIVALFYMMSLSVLVNCASSEILRCNDSQKNEEVRQAYAEYISKKGSSGAKDPAENTRSFIDDLTSSINDPHSSIVNSHPSISELSKDKKLKLLLYIYGYGAYFGVEVVSELPEQWRATFKNCINTVAYNIYKLPSCYLDLQTNSDKCSKLFVGNLQEAVIQPERIARLQEAKNRIANSKELPWHNTNPFQNGDLLEIMSSGRVGKYSGYPYKDWDNRDLESRHDYVQLIFPTTNQASAYKNNPYITREKKQVLSLLEQSGPDGELIKAQMQTFLLFNVARILTFWGIGFSGTENEFFIANEVLFQSKMNEGNHNRLRMSRVLQSMTELGFATLARSLVELLIEQQLVDINNSGLYFWAAVGAAPIWS